MTTQSMIRPKPLRFAVFGAGFWARVQLAAWRELGGVECVAIYNRSRERAEAFARDLGVPAVYDDAEKLLREMEPDFVDNITEIGGHKPLSLLCAKHRVPCIVQKPMAASLKDAREMVAAFARAKTPFCVLRLQGQAPFAVESGEPKADRESNLP
jgi:predicted dehydrogenase